MTREAPSTADLLAHPVVQAALAAAWADSFPDDPVLRHEEGGWVYMHETTGAITIRRLMPGRQFTMDVPIPPVLPNCYLVATYHTHPNPTAEGWIPEPSEDDRKFAFQHGIPCIVISDLGALVCGDDRRVGGLTGPRGYPF
ncbi:MAG: Mov34/MPN/PAD-1 family protein [Fimbriiglobus sp.]